MIRTAIAVFALLCIASESQAQFQPFGGRFRCQPVPRCQPQYYYYNTVPTYPQYVQPYYVVPNQPYIVPSVPNNAPLVVPAPRQEEVLPVVPKKTVLPPAEVVVPAVKPNEPSKAVVPDGPRVLPAPKRD